MRFLGISCCLALLAGCAGERVVLLPSADGRPSALLLRSPAGEQRLAAPYAGSVRAGDSLLAYRAAPEDVQARFGPALAAQPQRASTYVVYFVEGGSELTGESLEKFSRIKTAIESRPALEIIVVGHTDRVGSVDANDRLSMRRAESVREALVAAGLPEKAIALAGRGEREPAIPTEDEVEEPRNRRVEITVR